MDYPAPSSVLYESKEYVKEFQQIHGKPPIGETRTYETDEYIYTVKFHHNQKGNVDRTIYRKWRGSVFVVFLQQLYTLLKWILVATKKLFRVGKRGMRAISGKQSNGWGNRSKCPNCHRQRRRYDQDRFLKCHSCGWVIGYPVLRWLRYPTWIQHTWWWLKNRDSNQILSTVMDIPFYPLRKIDHRWWRVLPYKRQHVLLLGILIGIGIGYLLSELELPSPI